MPEETESVHNGATPRHGDATLKRWLGSASIVALGLIVGGFVLGDGLVRMKAAERSVTVRGLAKPIPIATPRQCGPFLKS